MQPSLSEQYRQHARELFQKVADPSNWKLPTKSFTTKSREEAEEMRDAIIFFVGGATIEQIPIKVKHADGLVWMDGGVEYEVTSLGYYHYIGA